ncbi:MAG TPA: glutamate--cysteine ligase, partial [Actinoplanes sp.]|nr:glutamate--cysteine ligase [Actinoplanes sp.]
GQFNLELNARPRLIQGSGFADYEQDLIASLARADDRAGKANCTVVLIGILPTLTPRHLVLANLSANERYRVLNDQIVGARGEDISLDIEGVERLQCATDSIVPEAACTSAQVHLQVPPQRFPDYWNASQAIAGVQVAIGANSPYLYGRQLWAETRIALFEQATDTRPDELKAQGVRPRVWFGERWITSIFDLFEENVRYFPPLLPILDDEDPVTVLNGGGVPRLGELRLHNGTVYRWNRPIYDVMNGRPHLRVENRVLPAGPTVVDMLANAAFYFGLTRELAEDDQPIWHELSFTDAEDNFHAAARRGIETTIRWPGLGEVKVTDLVLEQLLPKAYAGLDRFGVDPALRDRLLAIIEGRCRSGRNGAVWQTDAVWAAEHHRGLDRTAAISDMLLRYHQHQRSNTPVHTWPIP